MTDEEANFSLHETKDDFDYESTPAWVWALATLGILAAFAALVIAAY